MAATFEMVRKIGLPLALALSGLAAYEYLLRRPLPKVSGTVVLHGLDGSAEIIRDRWGVPHIYASTANDLYFAQGYVHAQDRLWQLEFQRRIGSGRLSEIFGQKALEADRLMRRVGMHRVAQVEAEALAGEAKEVLEAYSAGVNAYIETAGRNLPIEFTILRVRPEPWKAVDTLLWAKTMGWGLSTNWETELVRARLVNLIGPEEAARLEPSYPFGHPLVVPPGVQYGGIGDRLLETYQQIKELLQMSTEIVGSNNWVIDGEKSATGKPLLANDPHLLPVAPSIWYEVHLCAPGMNVTGASLPGAPGVVIGHNERISWGVTNSLADVQDLYVEKPHPDDPSLYQFRGSWERAQVVKEEIKVRGQDQSAVEEVQITRHGPIITPIGPAQSSPLALRWVGLEPNNMVASVLKLNRAANWDKFTEAIQYWDVPSQNFVYADAEGNIGYYLSGKVPIRAKGNGMVPVPGWTGEYEWIGYIPFEELPHALNPESHFVVTANNMVVSEDYPYFITSEWHNGYRARRITDLIQAKDKLAVDDFKVIQGDCYSLPCSQLAKHLLALVPQDRWQEEALRYVADWDGCLTGESVGGTVCQILLWRLQAKVFGHKLPGLVADYLGAGFHPIVPTNAFFGRSTPILLDLLDKRDDAWFGDPQCAELGTGSSAEDLPRNVGLGPVGGSEQRLGEKGKECHASTHDWSRTAAHDESSVPTRDRNGMGAKWQAVMENAFAETVAYLRLKLGDDVSNWRWGRLHQVTFSHIFANLRPLHILFNRGPFPMGGDADTVCQSAYLPHEPFQVKGTATYRQIVDLADFRNSVAMHAPGQSGHPASRHYDDLVKSWRAIQFHPMLFERKDVLAEARSILRFEPA